MKMKNAVMKVDNDSENEFDVDEPDEIQNNASDDDWTPEVSGGRRQSRRLRGTARPTLAEVNSSEEEEDEEDEEDDDIESEEENRKRRSRQKRGGGRQAKRPRVTSTTNENSESGDGEKSINNSDSEPSSTLVTNPKFGKQFSSGSFVVLKTDLANEGDPPLWKIDGKALLQKYIPFEQDGKKYYKNTSVYSGWTVHNKNQYYAATVVFKQQNKKEHIIEFQKDLINKDELVTTPPESEGDEGSNKDEDEEEEEEEDEEGEGEGEEDEEGEGEGEEEEGEEDEEEEGGVGEGEAEDEGDEKDKEKEEKAAAAASPKAPTSPNTTPSAE